MATKSVGRKAPARAPVAPATTPPALPTTPQAAQAQAQAVALLDGRNREQAETLLSRIVIEVHALKEQILRYQAELPVAAMLLMARTVGMLVVLLSDSPVHGDLHGWAFGPEFHSLGRASA